jgi:hypothetical protein
VDIGQVDRIILKVPRELADTLVSAGLAEEPPGRRSTNWEIIATFATGSATTISLLQGPQTLGYLVRTCLALTQRRAAAPAAQPDLGYLEAIGPKGQIRIPVTPGMTSAQIERLLRNTIFKD